MEAQLGCNSGILYDCRVNNHCQRQRAYSCGLVHDIGKVARLKLHPQSFCEDVGEAIYEEISLLEVEQRRILRHRVGQIVCNEWGLNRDVESVIRWHHEPDIVEQGTSGEDELNKLIDVVYVGNWLSHALHFGFSGHRSHGKLSQRLWKDCFWTMINSVWETRKL